jgi:opacity protein-like surface antigen
MATATLAGSLVLCAFAARAQTPEGLYLGSGLGMNTLSEGAAAPIGSTGRYAVDRNRPRFDTNARIVSSIGWSFGHGWRAELELTAFANTVDAKQRTSIGVRRNTGYESAGGGFVNVFYDIDTARLGLGAAPLSLTPYVGIGLGALGVRQHNVTAIGLVGASGATDTKRAVGASQLIVGAALPITPVPGLSATLEYRLLSRAGTGDRTLIVANGTTKGGLRLTGPAANDQSVMLGLRYAFGAGQAAR